MQDKFYQRLFWFSMIYFSLFILYGIINGDSDFLYYAFILLVIISSAAAYYGKIYIRGTILLGLFVLGTLHILGSNVDIYGKSLYDTWLLWGMIKYDNLVHTIGALVATLIAYSFLHPHVKSVSNKIVVSIIIILAGLGIGGLVEILELFAVVFFGASSSVGDYTNNAIDLVFDLAGSIAACIIVMWRRE